MTPLRRLAYIIRKLLIGAALRCPNCEKGRTFETLFRMETTCATCGVRFERRDGESLGGMAITLFVVPPIALTGFFLVNGAFSPPFWPHLLAWCAFILIACALIYRHSRSTWVAINFLTGGVYADPAQPDTTEARETLLKAMRNTRPNDP